MGKIFTRYGDGTPTEMSESELRADLEAGTEDAADRGKIPPLSEDELNHLYDIFSSPYKFISVEPGQEIVLTYDGAHVKMRRHGLNVERIQGLQIYEKVMGADTLELCHVDYSFKPLKPIVGFEQPVMEQALLTTHAPMFYGAMPNLGLYSQPDGPFPNPSELMPAGKIEEAQESHERAVAEAVKDIVFVGSCMIEVGADGINIDSTGAAGDSDFLAALLATQQLKGKYPDTCIEIGMAGEFILGMHAGLEFEGTRLAGLYPHDQVKLVEKAGGTIYGPVVNTNTTQSTPWNVARVVTFTKAVGEVAKIPIHANMGMGVGAVPTCDHPPIDTVSRASKAMVEICRLDGLQVGVGDPFAMALAHAHASGMGGMRTSGDLVARMQMTRGMKIQEAKEYVANKLSLSIPEITDPVIMTEVRQDLKLGCMSPQAGDAHGIEAKFRIAEVLGIEINCVNKFKNKVAF